MWTVDFLAVLPLVATHTVAFTVGAMTVAVAVGYFALVVSQGALLALPTRIALAFAVYVLASLTAENRTDALATVFTTKTRLALTMT